MIRSCVEETFHIRASGARECLCRECLKMRTIMTRIQLWRDGERVIVSYTYLGSGDTELSH